MTRWLSKTSAPAERCSRNWFQRSLCIAGAFLVLSAGFGKEGMDRNARIEIIRGLLREMAVTKIPMPRGKRGVRINSQGKLDQSDIEKELRTNGMAMQAGMPAEITNIEFKSKELVVEINGGGKSGKKWYQHIQIEMGGPVTTGTDQQQQDTMEEYGSSVTVEFDKPLPDMSVPEVKKVLAPVLDFERHTPTVLYSPEVPPEIKKAIKDHKVIVGMDRDAVLSAKGTPDRRVRETRNGSEQEDWIYGTPPHVLMVTFDGDQVVSVKQY